jgi:exopolysaccharide biosynthesis polyprenyl glycosylphosphotransferase
MDNGRHLTGGDPRLGVPRAPAVHRLAEHAAVRRPRPRRARRRSEPALRRRLESAQRRDALHRRPLAVSDTLAYLVAMWLAVIVVASQSLEPAVLLGIPVTLVLAKFLGLYDRDENRLHRSTLDEVPGLGQLATVVTLLATLGERLIATEPFSELDILVIWLALGALLVLGRVVTRALVKGLAAPERCVLIGDPRTTADVARKIELQGLNVEIARTLPPEELSPALGNGDVDASDAFIESVAPVVDAEHAHRVVLASGSWPAEHLLHAVAGLMASGIKVSVVPSTARLASLSYEVDQLPGMALLGMKKFGIGRSSQLLKRGFDIVVSATVLLVMAPVIAAIAVAIKLDSPGPVLYRSPRIGRNGQKFQMFKFRSMVADADGQRDGLRHLNQAKGLFKIPEDPRITRVGRVIRRRSLDELPQLFNVVRGQMSLVGPRPLVPSEDAQIEGDFRRRLNVSPGITGHWQILGSWRIPVDDMVVLDYLYAANWSLWSDLKLIARTVPFVASGRGA